MTTTTALTTIDALVEQASRMTAATIHELAVTWAVCHDVHAADARQAAIDRMDAVRATPHDQLERVAAVVPHLVPDWLTAAVAVQDVALSLLAPDLTQRQRLALRAPWDLTVRNGTGSS